MAVVAGVVFFMLRAELALILGVALRHPIKKWGAVAALFAATFYLVLSGAEVATQRSFIMIAIVLLGIMVDRAALTLRNLARGSADRARVGRASQLSDVVCRDARARCRISGRRAVNGWRQQQERVARSTGGCLGRARGYNSHIRVAHSRPCNHALRSVSLSPPGPLWGPGQSAGNARCVDLGHAGGAVGAGLASHGERH